MHRLQSYWKENKTTRFVSYGVVVLGICATAVYSWNWQIARTPSDQGQTSPLVSQENFEDLSTSSINNNTTYSTVISSHASPLSKNTAVYGVANSLQLETDQYKSILRKNELTGVQSTLSSSINSTDPIPYNFLEKKISLLQTIYSYLQINLVEITRGNSSPSKVLNDLEKKLITAQTDIQESISQIDSEVVRLQNEFTLHNNGKTTATAAYKAALTNFDGPGMNAALDDIIKEEQQAAEFYSRYKSFQQLSSIYKSFAAPISKKITILQANKEAFIKGVQVVAIPGMEEDLIITEKQWRNLTGK